ncbi:MAG: hypothetical protein AMS20_01460 [Gemmatimonas sp. SG8_28]|nr:MAG: hypothetical protein AMS20_01460 [Gemmatimonas sp. SG8_28]
MRRDHEPPTAIGEWGWRFHHLGMPTTEQREDEQYLPELGMYVSGFATSPYGVEWMRFDRDSPVSEIIQRMPHLAFEVDDLEAALEGKELLGPLSSPSEGVRVAMIMHHGMPIELLQFDPKIEPRR